MVALAGCGGGSGGGHNSVSDGGVGDGSGGACSKDTDCSGAQACVSGTCVAASACGHVPLGFNEVFGLGPCGDLSFSEDSDLSQEVLVDPEDGALVLASEAERTGHIWIVNTKEATVSKIDTSSLLEEARYRTGPRGEYLSSSQPGDDPSRTSVNTKGDAFIGNRQARSVTKIHGSGCEDRNGSGMIDTFTVGMPPLDWGDDECVAWNRSLVSGGKIRGVAAQDQLGLEGEIRSYVWVAGFGNDVGGTGSTIWKLDAETGDVLVETPSPVDASYGLALDGEGNLWVASRESNYLGRIDTDRCTTTANCNVTTCVATNEADNVNGDGCVKQAVFMPNYGPSERPYGMTVDFQQRVWVGGRYVTRYDPDATGGRFLQFTPTWTLSGHGTAVDGITADAEGWVWGASIEEGVVRMDANDPSVFSIVGGTEGYTSKGMAVDVDGKIWAITRSDTALVIEPGATAGTEVLDDTSVDYLEEPYTYSDMTGVQLRNATQAFGTVRSLFDGCESGVTEWKELRFDGDAPVGTRLVLRVRTATSSTVLQSADWYVVATVPSHGGTVDLEQTFSDLGVTQRSLLEVEVQLIRLETATSDLVTPRLNWLEVERRCPGSVQ